jgi:hypothetical protein
LGGPTTNLTVVADYNRAWPFVDAFKTARPWIAQQQDASWGQRPALQLDAHGWIASLKPGQYAETIMFDHAQNDQAGQLPTLKEPGYSVGLGRRWLIEKGFAWLKQTGSLATV